MLDDNEEHIIDIKNSKIINGNNDDITISNVDFSKPFYLIVYQIYPQP